MHVKVTGAPGYADFPAIFIQAVPAVDDRGELSVVVDWHGEPHVVPSHFVQFVEE